jgi:hypothetical protein
MLCLGGTGDLKLFFLRLTKEGGMGMRRTVLMLASMVAALLLACGVALAATISCDGGLCVGTDKPDTMIGSRHRDTMKGSADNDSLMAHASADTVVGGATT